MKKYIGIRMINIVLTLFVIISATFFLMKELPGSPFNEEKLAALPDEVRQDIYAQYGLDKPLQVQYVMYLKNLVQGDLGKSYYFKQKPVNDIIANRIGPSALIGFQAVLLGLTIGLIAGIIAAFKHNSMWDFTTMLMAVLGISIPNFVFAALLQYYVGLKMGILPVAFWENYQSTIMPTIALSLIVIALIARFMRNEMLEVLQQDYILTAKAKGMRWSAIIVKHAIRNALIPVITILGPIVVSLITGSLVIENIFAIPGLGSLFVESIKVNDYTTIMGVTIYFSAFFIITILIIDLLYAVIDPRIRLSNAKE